MSRTNAIIGWPTLRSRLTLSGGAWDAANGYGLDNLTDDDLSRVARSVDDAPASTKVAWTLDQSRAARLVSIVGHNCPIDSTMRVRMWSDLAQTQIVFDSGTVDVWPRIYPSSALEWEDDNWWTGRYTAEELAGTTWTRPIWLQRNILHRTGLIEIWAEGIGQLEIGMLDVAQGHQLEVNFGWGSEHGHELRSVLKESDGGGRSVRRRASARRFSGSVEMPRDEALGWWSEFVRQGDLTIPFVWFPFPGEPVHWLRTCWLAGLASPDLMSMSRAGAETVPFSFEEWL
jgi:hypothetical protein